MRYRDYEEDPVDPSRAYQSGFRVGLRVGLLSGLFAGCTGILLVWVWMVQVSAG